MAAPQLSLTCTNALANAASAGMREKMATTMTTITQNAMSDTGGALRSVPLPMFGNLATLATEIDLLEVPILVADNRDGENTDLTPLRSLIGDFTTRMCTNPSVGETGALTMLLSAYVAVAQIAKSSIPRLSEHIKPTGIRLSPVYCTAAKLRGVVLLMHTRGLAPADVEACMQMTDDVAMGAEAVKLVGALVGMKDADKHDPVPAGHFAEWEPFVTLHRACESSGQRPRDSKLETLVSFQLMLIAEAKRSPGPEQFLIYMTNRRDAVVGLLNKERMSVVMPSFAFSVESSRRSGVSGHLRELYLDLMASAAHTKASAPLSQSASWTMSTLAFTGMTAVSVVLLHIVRTCPEVLGWPMLSNEVLSLEHGMTSCFAPQWSLTGSDGEGWKWPFSQYLRLPGCEQLSWSRLNRLAQAAIVIAATVSPSLRKVSLTAGEGQIRTPDRYTTAIIDYVSQKLGSHSVILRNPTTKHSPNSDERALEDALAVGEERPVVAEPMTIEEVTTA